MAIQKEVKLDNGITLNYHRIAAINIELNQQVTLLVESYIDESGREYEKAYSAGEIENPSFPYTHSDYINLEYDENTKLFQGNVLEQAYGMLKEMQEYKGATDV